MESRLDGSFHFSLFKTKQNVKGAVQLVIFTPLSCELHCPVRALESFLAVRSCSSLGVAFFTTDRGVLISSKVFNVMLRRTLAFIGMVFNVMLRRTLAFIGISDVGRYSAKSFRVGAAFDAHALNIPFGDIRSLGHRVGFGSFSGVHP